MLRVGKDGDDKSNSVLEINPSDDSVFITAHIKNKYSDLIALDANRIHGSKCTFKICEMAKLELSKTVVPSPDDLLRFRVLLDEITQCLRRKANSQWLEFYPTC